VVGGAVRRVLSIFSRTFPTLTHYVKLLKGHYNRIADRAREYRSTSAPPLAFVGDQWGVATLSSKVPLSDSGYSKYTFTLPSASTLGLDLGQQVTLCCLDSAKNVVKSDFYAASSRDTVGSFDVIGLSSGAHTADKAAAVLGSTGATFHHVLDSQLAVGDEMAIKPGKSSLTYRGRAPVTNMVMFCAGLGVVPMLNQVREVLASRGSSVTSVTLVWVNEKTGEFDMSYPELEREFYKYTKKLEVSCCLSPDLYSDNLAQNEHVIASLPDYAEGTMAVVAGPDYFVKKATQLLVNRGYDGDSVCQLPE
jgi:hypothetical protein